MEAQDYLREIAQVNRNGFGFLVAYGFTWLTAAFVGFRFGERPGTYAALFQGMVGLPLGLLLTMAAADGPRPQDPTLNALSIYLSMGQLLVLPFVIVLVVRGRYTVAVATLAVTLAVHFVPYSWLYATPIYGAVAAVVAVGVAIVTAMESQPRRTVWQVCALTGAALLLGGVTALTT
jgi:hypothetical protein